MMDKVAVSRAVTKLIKNGRVDREFADADKRRSILNLSEEGQKLHDEIAELALQFERDLLEGISDRGTRQPERHDGAIAGPRQAHRHPVNRPVPGGGFKSNYCIMRPA